MRKFLVPVLVVGVAGAAVAAYVGTAAAQERSARAPMPAAATSPALPASPAPAASPASPASPAIDAGDPGLTYRQDGRAVTIRKGGARVATVTVTSARYAGNSADVVLAVAAERPITVDPAMFVVYDAEGFENDAKQTTPVRFGSGAGSLTLTFPRTAARPMALGWVPQQDRAAAAVWERG